MSCFIFCCSSLLCIFSQFHWDKLSFKKKKKARMRRNSSALSNRCRNSKQANAWNVLGGTDLQKLNFRKCLFGLIHLFLRVFSGFYSHSLLFVFCAFYLLRSVISAVWKTHFYLHEYIIFQKQFGLMASFIDSSIYVGNTSLVAPEETISYSV